LAACFYNFNSHTHAIGKTRVASKTCKATTV